jgi:hypothetical protein
VIAMYSFILILIIFCIVGLLYLFKIYNEKQRFFREFYLNRETLELYSLEYNSKISEFQVKNQTEDIIILQAPYNSCADYIQKLKLIKIGRSEGELKK